MKETKVTIFEEKEILQKLKNPLSNFRKKSLNGNLENTDIIKIDALTQEKKLREVQFEKL